MPVALRKESVDRNIFFLRVVSLNYKVALRKESVDRNKNPAMPSVAVTASLSARRAWIEMHTGGSGLPLPSVALRKESVDRNKYVVQCRKVMGVALRKESVDRNPCKVFCQFARNVALRKESVDRNIMYLLTASGFFMSLSARRAWIEMTNPKD